MKKSELRQLIREEIQKEYQLKGISSGTTDSNPPERYSEYTLSRISDIIEISKVLEERDEDFKNLSQKIFSMLPTDAKIEWNYSKWNYSK
jgi:hypothetical protein